MRTAICITGQSRSFGEKIANSIHENVYSVLENNGFDVFLIHPGMVRYPKQGLVAQWTGNASLLEPKSTNRNGVPNMLFQLMQGEQHNLEYVKDNRWSNNFLVKRTHNVLYKQMYIQNLLYMAHDQYLCHNITSSGMYTFKVRMRPDMLFHRKMPWTVPRPGVILASSSAHSTIDQFAFGTVHDMTVYLSRYPLYNSMKKYSYQKQWTTESFLQFCLTIRNISIIQHDKFLTSLIRPPNFTRLLPCTSELAEQLWNPFNKIHN